MAVNDCSLDIPQRTVTGIVGPNGAGKSTLFNIVAGFLKPTSGQIHLDGHDVTGLSAHELFRHGLVRTFQIPREFGKMTVLENLMLVPPRQLGENLIKAWLLWHQVMQQEKDILRKAEDVLNILNLWSVRDELAKNLSGGQKKLLELGRSLMVDPKVILLDEPGAGVNRTLLKDLTETIQRLNTERGCTICLIEHNLELVASLCDRVIVMSQGAVLAQGTMESIRQHPEVQAAYLGSLHNDLSSSSL
ncbi:ABC transporter ATP-binding protein [Oscillatoria sp. CS-180]|uniref:ABC transporter ATP-binding protein n=1 Tax=Oscillatoria sp. CS-180 TaxID=3021720 RepID=UPI00232FC1D6|nr:ABC transporter ATP-binding protein [Oscillatoria sp. CS-180]MDB9527592.1 ABC transporter ATP-binding protein [Oscillatoria sp. CS-180]